MSDHCSNEAATNRDYNPQDVLSEAQRIMLAMAQLRHANRNRVEGILPSTPTSASTQGAGVGNTDWNVNLGQGFVTVDGVTKHYDAQADYDVHSGSLYTGLVSGYSAVAAIVAKNVTGTVSMVVVKGAAAATGAQLPPTAAAIQAAVGAGNKWVRICNLTLNRTGDATCTQAQDSAARPILGLSLGTDFGYGI